MINESEEIYVKGILENYYNIDYKNYVCITNNPSNTYNQSYYDIYCYLSKEEIQKSNNTYTITNGKKCSIDTKSATSTYKQDTINCINYSGSVSASTKEFVYSNNEGDSNLIANYQMQNELRYIEITIVVVLLISLLYKLLKNIVK